MFKVHLRRVAIFVLIAGVIGWLVGSRMPKIYEAVVEIQVGSANTSLDSNLPTSIKTLLLPSLLNDLDSDIGVLRSTRVFSDGLNQASINLNRPDLRSNTMYLELFPKYEVEIPTGISTYAQVQTRVVKLKVKAYDPEAATEIANQVAYAFSDIRKQRIRGALGDSLSTLEAQVKTSKAELVRIDQEYQKIKMNRKVGDFTEESRILATLVEQLKDRRDQAEINLESTRKQLVTMQQQVSSEPLYVKGSASASEDPAVNLTRQQLAQSESELDEAKRTYLDDSTQVRAAQEKVDSVKKRLASTKKDTKKVDSGDVQSMNPLREELRGQVASLKADLVRYQNEVAGLNANIAEREAQVQSLPGDEIKIQQLLRDRSVAEEKYIKGSGYITEFGNAMEGRSVPIISLARAERAKDPVAPDVRRWVIFMCVGGAFLGIVFSFALESFRLPVHTSWQLSELTSLPVAASVPALPKPVQRRHTSEIVQSSFRPIESFRYMAFSTFAKENRPKVIMFTSVGQEVDSSASAAEFAVAVARTGAKTILVDCDLRESSLTKIFGAAGRTGVSDILGRTVLPGENKDIYTVTQHENLLLLPSGSSANSGLLDYVTSHVQVLFDQLREESDMVVINCPAVDVFSDAARMASFVDETALVVSAKSTSYRAIPVAQEILSRSGAKQVSIVLVNASSSDEPFGSRASENIQPA